MPNLPLGKLPLEGIRILDMTLVWAGPYATALLADLGAEIIRVESTQFFPPLTRGVMAHPSQALIERIPVFVAGLPNMEVGQRPWNRWPLFNSHARNKLSMTVDLLKPEGKEVFRRLVEVSDVLVENNPTDTMEKLGISYESLTEINSDFIMLRMPGFGNSGAYKNYRAVAPMNEDVAGHNTLRGYTDMDATGVTSVYAADAASGAGGAFAVLSALNYRRRTGKGQLVELAQVEHFLPYLGQAIMDFTMNQHLQTSLGNRHPYAIQGCYQCLGEDRWVCITIFNDADWDAFRGALGNPQWAEEEKFADPLSRLRHHDEIDQHISQWTSQIDHIQVMERLQSAGVAAGPVLDQRDAYNDPHLQERGIFQEAYQEDTGTHKYPGAPFKLSETPAHIRRGPVRLGEDNEYVYKTLLKYSDEEYANLEESGHIGMEYAEGVP